MTDLLTSATTRQEPDSGVRRHLGLAAGLAGLASAGALLVVCMALGLVGWFASDAGGHGDTRDALRVGADAWLLAHGSGIALPTVTLSVVPLGLTGLCAYVTFRIGRRTGASAAVDDDRALLLGTTVLAGVHAVVATLTAVLASLEQARTEPGVAFAGGFVLAFVCGGAGLAVGSGRWSGLRDRLPVRLVAASAGALSGVLLMVAAGALLLAAALVVDLGAAANVLGRLHTGPAGGLLYSLVVAAVAPNAALLGGSYLVGPGFAVGTGTVVSPTVVALGPVPAFPLLAALPDDGATPGWLVAVVGVPVLVGAVAAAASLRRYPVLRYDLGAAHGLAVGLAAGAGFGALTVVAGGAVGPGRMRDVGALAAETALSAAVAMGVGGLLAALVVTWWLRRGR